MKKWITAITYCVLIFLVTAPAGAGSPVWKVSGPASHLFIGGTIHILGASDYPLPDAFDRAYSQADLLVFETDLAATQSEPFTKELMGQMVYTDGRTLRERIRPETFRALSRFAGERGLAPEDLNRFKPGLIMIFLTMTEMQRMGMAGTGVDEFYFQKGQTDKMPMQFLESPMEQIRFLADIGKNNEDEMIDYILKDVGELPGLVTAMKGAWRQGDLSTLHRISLAPVKKEFPDLYRSLMVNRNQNWLPRIQKMLATPEVEFILVGAAHLAGEDGLLTRLKAKGADASPLN